MADLSNARVLMLATDGFEQDELFKPRQALLDAGAQGDAGVDQDRSDPGREGRREGRDDHARPDAR